MPRSPRSYPQSFLLYFFADGLRSAFTSKKNWRDNKTLGSYERYRQTAYHLRRQGVISIARVKGQKFLQLTKKGQLEVLVAKAWIKRPDIWDGKWRVVFFDIPEVAHAQRNKLRGLLRANDFVKLQHSVYVHPYPLGRDGIAYLRQSGLIKYIRFGRLEELDDDKDLRKTFNLK